MLVYFVEDDQSISFIINKTLERIGLERQGFLTGKDFLDAYHLRKPDLILLDVMLPDSNGIDLLKTIRKTNKTIPIIIVSALFSEMDKVHALDAGADDYVTKPFGVLELSSRIQAKLRNVVSEELVLANVKIDLRQYLVYINDELISLTNKQFDILTFLFKNKDQVLDKEEIFLVVWETDYMGETRTLDMHIATLRQILKENNSKVEIKTVRGIGYKLGVSE